MLLSWDFGIADAGCDPFTCDKIVVKPDIAFHRACLAIGQNPSVERPRRDSHGAPGGLTGAENLAARRMRSACRDAPVLSKMWARLVRSVATATPCFWATTVFRASTHSSARSSAAAYCLISIGSSYLERGLSHG